MGEEQDDTSRHPSAAAASEDIGARLREASPTGRHLFALLSRAAALETLYEVGVHGPIRFSELKTRLDVSSATLSARLSELVEAGFIERRSFDQIPPRVEYSGTDSLDDFKPIFVHLVDWIDRHGFEVGDTPAGESVPGRDADRSS